MTAIKFLVDYTEEFGVITTYTHCNTFLQINLSILLSSLQDNILELQGEVTS